MADETLAKAELERGRKRDRQSEDLESRGGPKRRRSASSTSVSTVSTDRSTSRPLSKHEASIKAPVSKSSPSRSKFRSQSLSRSPVRHSMDLEKKRRRTSYSSVDSYTSDDQRDLRDRADSRSTRRRFQERSPRQPRGRKTESRSPYRGRRNTSIDRPNAQSGFAQDGRRSLEETRPITREKSLSPFSKRLALTQSMNMGR